MNIRMEPADRGTVLANYLSIKGTSETMGEQLERAERLRRLPDVMFAIKNEATNPQTTGNTPLAQSRVLSEYLGYERGASIVGMARKFMKSAVFMSALILQKTAALTAWIAESGRTPVSAFQFDKLSLHPYKLGTSSVFTKDVVRLSTPSAASILSQSLPLANARFIDNQFLDPSLAEVTDTNPASITYGASSVSSTGSSAAQMTADFISMTADLGSWTAAHWIMQPKTLSRIAATVPPLVSFQGADAFLMGIPVIRSANAPAAIVLVDLAEILYADEDETSIAVARSGEAALVMDDGGSPTVTTLHSMFQEGLVVFRAIRTISWARAHDNSVVYMTVSY